MNFKKTGDQEIGHYHEYDHGTLLAKGKVLVEKFDDDDNLVSSKVFTAPTFIFIAKDVIHRLTSLEDDTIATCIHALRDLDDEIIDPSMVIESQILADEATQVDRNKGIVGVGEFYADKGVLVRNMAKKKTPK
jgi:hypothetical protein